MKPACICTAPTTLNLQNSRKGNRKFKNDDYISSEWLGAQKNMCAGFGIMECKCYGSRPVAK